MNIQITLIAKRVATLLLKIVGILVILSLLGRLALAYLPDFPIRNLLVEKFYLDEEGNIPTLYSFLSLMLAASLLFLTAKIATATQSSYVKSWRALSFVFIYLAVDEMISLHEHLNDMLHRFGVGSGLNFVWTLPASCLVLVTAIAFAKFLFHLPRLTRLRIIFAGGLYIFGAVGIEVITSGLLHIDSQEGGLLYQIFMTSEESCEMLGVIAFINAILMYLNQYYGLHELTLQVPIKFHIPATELDNSVISTRFPR